MRYYFIILVFFLIGRTKSIGQKIELEIVYNNFSETHKPDFKSIITVRQKGNLSISYMMPLDYNQMGLNKKAENSKGEKVAIFVYYGDTIKRYVYKNFENNTLAFQSPIEPLYKEYKNFDDSLHGFQWNLFDKMRIINSINCQMAQMDFRGRKYTAWFTNTIPISNGPWKFGGLPGLILEIYDEEMVVYWKAASIKFDSVSIPEWPSKIDGNFFNYKNEYKVNFEKFKKAVGANQGVNNPNCKTCGGSSSIISKTPENLTE